MSKNKIWRINMKKQQEILFNENNRNSEVILNDDILNNCKKIGFTPKIVFETSQRELMLQTVGCGLGVAILPSRLCPFNEENSDIVVRPLTEPKMTHHLYAIWKKGRYLSRATRLWIEFTKEHLAFLHNDI